MKKYCRIALSWIFKVVPTYRHCVVYGWPDLEGNSVEVVRYLIRHYRGRIFWLTLHKKEEMDWLINDIEGYKRVLLLNKKSWRSFAYYITAEAVFYTHGLFLSPTPDRKRIFVNLWHGDGPKRTENSKYRVRVGSTLLVAGTVLWGEYKRVYFGLEPSSLVVVGNPRIDQFKRPISDEGLIKLGLDPRISYILWLPTFRNARSVGGVSWEDAKRLSAHEDIRDALSFMARFVAARGFQLLLKPHAMEADQYQDLGIKIINDDDLAKAHVCFYQLIARSSALITDYSSVWTDYLVLNHPIAFFCPDLAEYEAKRGFNVPNFTQLLPGPIIRSKDDMTAFLGETIAGQRTLQYRERSVALIGAVTELGACERLFKAINQHRNNCGLSALTEVTIRNKMSSK